MKTLITVIALLFCTSTYAADWSGVFARSRQLEYAGRFAAAVSALKPLAKDDADNYLLNLRLGWLEYRAGDYVASAHYYKAAIMKRTDAVEPRLGMLLPLLAAKQWAEAEQVARQILAVDPYNYYANLRLVIALREQGKLDLAERQAGLLLSRYPADSTTLKALREVYQAENKSAAVKRIDGWLGLLGVPGSRG